jgi:predicted RNase H-like nuclease
MRVKRARDSASGQSATWFCCHSLSTEVNLAYPDAYLQCEIPFGLARLADGYYNVPRGDRRAQLARKASSLIHECFKANDYGSFSQALFHSTCSLVVVGIIVGSIR